MRLSSLRCTPMRLAIAAIFSCLFYVTSAGHALAQQLTERDRTFLQFVFTGDEQKAVEYAQIANIDVNAIAGKPLAYWLYQDGHLGGGRVIIFNRAVQKIVFGRFHQNPNTYPGEKPSLLQACNYAPTNQNFGQLYALDRFGSQQQKDEMQQRTAKQQQPFVAGMADGFKSLLGYGLKDRQVINQLFIGCFFNNAANLDEDLYDNLLKQMVDAGADVNARDGYNVLPIQVAIRKGNPELIQRLFRDGARTDLPLRDQLNHSLVDMPCSPRRDASLYEPAFNWVRANNPDVVVRILKLLNERGFSPYMAYGVGSPGRPCSFTSFYDAVVNSGNIAFAKLIKGAIGESPSSRPPIPQTQTSLPASPASPNKGTPPDSAKMIGNWRVGFTDGEFIAALPVPKTPDAKALTAILMVCAAKGGLDFVVVPNGTVAVRSLIPDDVEGSTDIKPFAVNSSHIGAPDNVRFMKRLLAEESAATQSGAGNAWTFSFYMNDAATAGYSINPGGIGAVRQSMLKQCAALKPTATAQ